MSCWNYRSVYMDDTDLWASVHCQMTSQSGHTQVAVQISSFGVTNVMFATQLCDSLKNVSHLISPPISPTRHQLLGVQNWVAGCIYIFTTPLLKALPVGWWEHVHFPSSTPVTNLPSTVITPCTLKTLTVPHIVNQFPGCDMSIAVLTTTRHLSVSWARSTHSTPSHYT
jgi:hypothetical protein